MSLNLEEVKEQLASRLVEEYGSVNKFSKHEDAVTLKVEKSVTTVLSKGGKRNSLRILNILRKKYGLPIITKTTVIERSTIYTETLK